MEDHEGSNADSQSHPEVLAPVEHLEFLIADILPLKDVLHAVLGCVSCPNRITQIVILRLCVVVAINLLECKVVGIGGPVLGNAAEERGEDEEQEGHDVLKQVLVGEHNAVHQKVHRQYYDRKIGGYEDDDTSPLGEPEVEVGSAYLLVHEEDREEDGTSHTQRPSERVEEECKLPGPTLLLLIKCLTFFSHFLFNHEPASAGENEQQVEEGCSKCPKVKIHDAFLDVDVEVQSPYNDERQNEGEPDPLHSLELEEARCLANAILVLFLFVSPHQAVD